MITGGKPEVQVDGVDLTSYIVDMNPLIEAFQQCAEQAEKSAKAWNEFTLSLSKVTIDLVGYYDDGTSWFDWMPWLKRAIKFRDKHALRRAWDLLMIEVECMDATFGEQR